MAVRELVVRVQLSYEKSANMNLKWHHPLEIIDFSAEEPTELGISAVGSRDMSGAPRLDMLSATNVKGQKLHKVLSAVEGRPDAMVA